MATTTAVAETESTHQLVVFALGEEEYALPIRQVQEIIRWAEPRAVSSSDPWVLGVISLRGKIIPVFDLGVRIGIHAEPGADQKIVIIEADNTAVGVVVDAVEEVLTVAASQIDDAAGTGTDAIDAIAKIEDRLIVLLNPERLVSDGTEAAYA